MSTRREYAEKFSGRLFGVLDWNDFSRLWDGLRRRPDGWYVRDFRRRVLPARPMPVDDFSAWLEETEDFLRKRHREDYCGFLYVDDKHEPSFIKVFDPRKMGSACGCGGEVTPRWTVSRARPGLPEESAEEAKNGEKGPSFLRRIFGGG